MGANQSSAVEIGGSTMGYQVLRVYPDGPGARAGLKAYFDFIVAIGNTRFNRETGSLREILKASVDQKLKMMLYNTRTKQVRETDIVPSLNWGGNGLLGVSIKHTSFDRADERVWHVVEVEPGSPAAKAGLKSNEDYVIGADSILQENDDLYNLIEAHDGKALKLFVYNVNTDNCREVICHPNTRWGGAGYLGCEFGHGLLHRIPTNDSSQDPSKKSLVSNDQLLQQTSQHQHQHQQQPTQLHQLPQLQQQQPVQHQQQHQQMPIQATSPMTHQSQQASSNQAAMPQQQHQQPQQPRVFQDMMHILQPSQPSQQINNNPIQMPTQQQQSQQLQQKQDQLNQLPCPPPPPSQGPPHGLPPPPQGQLFSQQSRSNQQHYYGPPPQASQLPQQYQQPNYYDQQPQQTQPQSQVPAPDSQSTTRQAQSQSQSPLIDSPYQFSQLGQVSPSQQFSPYFSPPPPVPPSSSTGPTHQTQASLQQQEQQPPPPSASSSSNNNYNLPPHEDHPLAGASGDLLTGAGGSQQQQQQQQYPQQDSQNNPQSYWPCPKS